ncbi:MAG: V-type ATP synthase subunit E [Verrucomicrobia bacterium]|nr:V-type ATP synthase subunit E [Verrucomicrobiota bacterium]
MTDQERDPRERADQRIQVICDKIRTQTLDPAKEQAQEIIEQALKDAEQIREKARLEAEQIQNDMRQAMQEEKQIFQSSLHQAGKQAVELLKQKIEQALFNPALDDWMEEQMGSSSATAKLIDVLVEAIQKDGLETAIAVKVSQRFTPDEINALLSQKILHALKNHSVELADLEGGVQVKLSDKKMAIDLSMKTLEEIIRSFVRKDFRKIFFSS